MTEFDVNTGHDTWVNELATAQNNSLLRLPAIRGGDELRILLFMPLAPSRVSGKTVLSATLSVAVHGNWVDQTVTAQALDAEWNVDQVTWANQPGVIGSTASSGATGALAMGDRFEIDVTALVQAIADGQANYGWRLTTSQTTDRSTVRGFDYGDTSWTLTVEVSDVPAAPTQQSPAGVIATDKWVAQIDEVDNIAQINVQVDAAADAVSPDFDSGWVATTLPKLDLSTTAYAGLADGATTYWRARAKLSDTTEGEWSDWVEVTRDDLPALTTSATTIYDPTPTFTASLTPAGDADTRWQVIIHDVGDPTAVRYNSGDALTGATLAHEVPLTWQEQTVFPADGTYQRVIRAWDRSDRVPTEGVPTFVRDSSTITLTTEAAVTAPADVTAAQSGDEPVVTIGWTRATDPMRFGVWRDDELIATVEPGDVTVSPGVYSYDDTTAKPNTAHTYKVRAVADNAGTMSQSVDSGTAAATPATSGVWLRGTSNAGSVKLFGREGMDVRQVDKRQIYELPYRAENLEIITAIGGFVGTFTGGLKNATAEKLALLERWRLSGEQLRVVWGTHNILANVNSLSVAFDPRSGSDVLYVVSFGFSQVAEAV